MKNDETVHTENGKRAIKNAEILCVGTELLIGEVINTNSSYISRKLCELGISVYHTAVIGDNPERLKDAFLEALEKADLVILSGGLGPTYDDLTKETVAKALGREMVRDKKILSDIESYFYSTGRKMTENNKKQADIPSGAAAIENKYGTAPGISLETSDGRLVILLPGPPRELEPMMRDSVFPMLRSRSGKVLVSKNIHIIGMGEAEVETVLCDLMRESKNPSLAPYAKDGEVRLRVTALADDEKTASDMCDGIAEKVKASRVGRFIYGIDVGNIENALFKVLKEKGLTLSCAESCTGGMIAKRMTDLPGVSAVFEGGCVTYSCESKIKLLGVSRDTLEKYGAVSEEIALQMARGVREKFGTDIGISSTGSAGPAADPTSSEPVGTVYIGFSDRHGDRAIRLSLSDKRSRDYIRYVASSRAFALALANLSQK